MRDLIDLVNLINSVSVEKRISKVSAENGESLKGPFLMHLLKDEAPGESSDGESNFQPLNLGSNTQLAQNQLLKSLFVMDLLEPSFNGQQKAYVKCYKDWGAAKILFANQAYSAGLSLCSKVMKYAKKYGFTQLLMDVSSTLALYYGTITGESSKYEDHHQLFKKYQELNRIESRAEEYYHILFLHNKFEKEVTQAFLDFASRQTEDLQADLKEYHSIRLHFFARLHRIEYLQLSGSLDAALKYCENTLTYIIGKGDEFAGASDVLYIKKATLFLKMGAFDEVIKLRSILSSKMHSNTFYAKQLNELIKVAQKQKTSESFQQARLGF